LKKGEEMNEVILEKKGKTAYVTLNRPEQKNAINLEIRKRLCEIWSELENDSEICTVIVTGGNKVFSVGQDIFELKNFRTKYPMNDVPVAPLPLNEPETAGAKFKKPIIAAISGYCLGWALMFAMEGADIRIATNTAQFGMPELERGIIPFLGFQPRLARFFPPAIAMELLISGRNIGVNDAFRFGFVNKIVPQEELLSTAQEYADAINNLSPYLVSKVKEIFRAVTAPDPIKIAYSDAVASEGRFHPDYMEGLKAFAEKRKPNWKKL
jgi:enoyl-CoA hydratase/carnithine racemase